VTAIPDEETITVATTAQAVVVDAERVDIVLSFEEQTVVAVESAAPEVVVATSPSPVDVDARPLEPLLIEVVERGPPGFLDPAFVIKPDSVLSYDVDDRLIRVDYADGTFKDLTYNAGGQLVTVSGVRLDGDTVTKTLTYTGDLLTAVTTTIT
jgi:YD repeat-containing protein